MTIIPCLQGNDARPSLRSLALASKSPMPASESSSPTIYGKLASRCHCGSIT
jgi:hypothetical protein